MDLVIEARSLVKRLGQQTLVNGVQFEVRRGEVFGIYGPSGAGKTSLLKMIYCSSPLTSGDLFVLGLNATENPSKVKSRIGVMPQQEGLDLDFTALDNLLIFATYHGIDKKKARPLARDLLRKLRLDDYADEAVENLEPGARRRLMVARCLMNDPEIIFLDEPTAGLPPEEKRYVWKLFQQLIEQKKSLVITSSDPKEVEQVCDRAMIFDQGKALDVGEPKALIKSVIGTEVIDVRVSPSELDYYVKKIKSKYTHQIVNNGLRLYLKANQDHKEALATVSGHHVTVRAAGLEDVYIKLSGSEFWKKERRL